MALICGMPWLKHWTKQRRLSVVPLMRVGGLEWEACINDAMPWMTIYNLKIYEMLAHLSHNIVKRWDLAAVETNGSDGGYDSSSLQLATWLATGLKKMRPRQRLPEVQTVQGNGENKLRPFAHIAAVGHMWNGQN
ncbi:repeat set, removed [Histoplasma capsulatum]|uniref:Repeat set, removed n=1 Tax=Ajellomyces capsulatus TaxID=5037 RepID=A0A8A1M1K7_AJECA|nr:repeat set, removed [Histoplasma capsulatum]